MRNFNLAKFIIFFVLLISSAWSKENQLTPFLIQSENILEYNKKVIAQRERIRDRRMVDQRRKFKGKFSSWIKDRPHAYYQRVLMDDAPIVLTPSELPDEVVFYDLFPELRKSARVDYEQRRYNDRMRFIDYDRHQTILGETVFEEMTGRYLDPDDE